MAKNKVTYIQGGGPDQYNRDGERFPGVTSFWHIRAPRARQRTLCGQMLQGGIVTSGKKPKETERTRALCKTCVRVSEGRDPVFDSTLEQGYKREEHMGPKGTRASSKHFGPLYGEWNRGEKVA